jgi:hypothetical protein
VNSDGPKKENAESTTVTSFLNDSAKPEVSAALCHQPDEKPGWHEFQLHASTFARFSKQKQRSRAPARELEASS